MLEKHFFCVKCNAGKTVIGQSPVMLKNGATALKGKCPSCESTTYKIVNKEALKKKITENHKKSDNMIALALATFALGLAVGAAISIYI